MQLTKSQRHRLNAATLLAVNAGCGPFVAASLVLASGILPVRFSVLLLLGVAAGAVASIPAVAFARNFKVLAAAGVLGTMVLTTMVFLRYQSTGLEHAKRHGETWAAAIRGARQARGSWPASIAEALPQQKVAAPRLPWPYLASCHDDWCKVAGYYLSYRGDASAPHLLLGRRDIALEWDWSASTWRSSAVRHPPAAE